MQNSVKKVDFIAFHSSLNNFPDIIDKFLVIRHQIYQIFSRPGQSQRLLYKQPRDSLIKSLSHFLPQLYGAAMPKWLKIALPVIK